MELFQEEDVEGPGFATLIVFISETAALPKRPPLVVGVTLLPVVVAALLADEETSWVRLSALEVDGCADEVA